MTCLRFNILVCSIIAIACNNLMINMQLVNRIFGFCLKPSRPMGHWLFFPIRTSPTNTHTFVFHRFGVRLDFPIVEREIASRHGLQNFQSAIRPGPVAKIPCYATETRVSYTPIISVPQHLQEPPLLEMGFPPSLQFHLINISNFRYGAVFSFAHVRNQ